MKPLIRSFILTVLLLLNFLTFANNLSLTNINLTGLNTAEGYMLIEFDISWDNSWRLSTGPANWDAAWIFVKFSPNTGPYKHATLNYVDGTAANDGHTQPTGSTITTTNDGKGVFIHRNATGNGSNNWTGVQLRWNYVLDGVSPSFLLDVQIFAMEMVYVAEGAFAVGSGGTGVNELDLTTINTADASVVPSGSGSHGGAAGGHHTNAGSNPNTNWPNGYKAYYCMKYEMSEEQFVTYYNLLTASQQSNNNITDNNHKNLNGLKNRNTITVSGNTATTTVPDRACSYFDYSDVLAYLDWVALRPMTEYEFEKACRGTSLPSPDEYAWGTPLIHAIAYTLANGGQPNAIITTPATTSGTGNASYKDTDGALNGPLRVGIFANSAVSPERALTGGSYWGIMELSGNLIEPTVAAGDTDTDNYDGLHGDGELSATGEADVANWPSSIATDWYAKGGSWNQIEIELRVSDRTYQGWAFDAHGIRGVRTAP